MINFVDLEEEGIDNIVVDHFKVGVAHPVLKVPLSAGVKVVCHYHFVALERKRQDF